MNPKSTEVDIREFMEKIAEEQKKTSTSNKAIMWTFIAVIFMIAITGVTLSIVAIFMAQLASSESFSAKQETTELRYQLDFLRGQIQPRPTFTTKR